MVRRGVSVLLYSMVFIVRCQGLWRWTCNNSLCERIDPTDQENVFSSVRQMSLAECKLVCDGTRSLWPLPTGDIRVDNSTATFCSSTVSTELDVPEDIRELTEHAVNIFRSRLQEDSADCSEQTSKLDVRVQVESSVSRLNLYVSELYHLKITSDNRRVQVHIIAPTFFGARHAMETLSQLMVFDESTSRWLIVRSADIHDAPAYPYRALTIDTARNFISVQGLRRTLDAMSWNKLNTLHWHITDSHSFPLHVPTAPKLSQYGAYSSQQVYRPEDVDELVQYALRRGIRIIPELDGPAHAGFGWQWGEKEGLGSLVSCLNKEPWQMFCVEPPCGQMNVVNDNLYPILEKIMKHYNDTFQPDMFHFGGDEVNLNCWKSTDEISDFIREQGGDADSDSEYIKLWIDYQTKMLAMWNNMTGGNKPAILWTSHLTELDPAVSKLDPGQYIIHVWTKGDDNKIGDLLKRGYRLIFSNYDSWYLDCGFSAWVGKGNNWCSPYKSWQTVYDNSLLDIAERFSARTDASLSRAGHDSSGSYWRQILGGSAALWSEQADDSTLDVKLWPRGAALAERLWSDPKTDSLAAEHRFVHHRRRMVARGVMAETVQPQYCHEHEGRCYIN